MEALFGPIIALARISLARGKAAAGRYSIAAMLGVLGVIAAMASVGLGLLALWIFLLPCVGAAGAALILAGVLTLLCFTLLTLTSLILRQDPRDAAAEPAPDVSLLAVTQLFNDQKGGLLLAALIAGFSVGAGPPRSKR